MLRKILSTAACLSLLAASGCGSDSSNEAAPNGEATTAPATQAAQAGDPCALVTKEEVAAATGETIVSAQADGDSCTYATDDAMASSVTLEVKRTGGGEEMKVARQAAGVLGEIGGSMASQGGAQADAGEAIAENEAAPGIGDEAFFGANQQLHVRKQDAYLAITPPTMRSRMSSGNPMLAPEDKRKMAAAIAERALSRL